MRIFKLILILFFVQQVNGFGQVKQDSANIKRSKADTTLPDSGRFAIPPPFKTYQSSLQALLAKNKFIDLKKNSVLSINKKKKSFGKEYLFYLLSAIILVFGFFKVFYGRYFHNVFRVFFNTSMRQNQLTDLLLQARLPSLIFNTFFAVIGGLYTWLLITHFLPVKPHYSRDILFFCVVSVGAIYVIKFCVLKFIGWITGMSTILNTYIFVVFLINKIMGIALIPLVVFLTFASPVFFKSTVMLSFLLIVIFFLTRFFRSYSLLQPQIGISRFHFLIYILSLEILPLLVIYKLSLRFLLRH